MNLETIMTDYIETPAGVLSSKSMYIGEKTEGGETIKEWGIQISIENKTVAYVTVEDGIITICAWVPDNFGTPNYKAEVVLP